MSGYLHVLTEGMLIDFIIAKIKVFTTFLTLGWHILLRKVRNWMKQNVWLTEDKFYVDCLPQSSRNLFESVLLLRSLKIRVYFTMVWDNSEYLFGRDFSKDDNWTSHYNSDSLKVSLIMFLLKVEDGDLSHVLPLPVHQEWTWTQAGQLTVINLLTVDLLEIETVSSILFVISQT